MQSIGHTVPVGRLIGRRACLARRLLFPAREASRALSHPGKCCKARRWFRPRANDTRQATFTIGLSRGMRLTRSLSRVVVYQLASFSLRDTNGRLQGE